MKWFLYFNDSHTLYVNLHVCFAYHYAACFSEGEDKTLRAKLFVNIPSQVTKASVCIVRQCIHQLPVSHAPPCYHGNCALFHPHLLETSHVEILLSN